MSDIISGEVCAICRLVIDLSEQASWQGVGADGLHTLLHYSTERNDSELTEYLTINTEIKVHTSCRKRYVCKRRLDQELRAKSKTATLPSKPLRSTGNAAFDWKQHCMLCGDSAAVDTKNPERAVQVSAVETLGIRETLLKCCHKRNDAWSLEVQGRLNMCCDLVAVEAVYHRRCLTTFTTLWPGKTPGVDHKAPGRPVSEKKLETFEAMCRWIELCDDELSTLGELQDKMQDLAFGDEDAVYSKPQLKIKLEEKYGDHIFFAEVAGKRNVICFKNMASCIVNDKWYSEKKSNIEDESMRIVVAAAKLIKAQIRDLVHDLDKYPLNSELSNVDAARQWVPTLLNEFMENVVCDDRKQVALSHCIVQAARPRSVIAPIPFGLGVALDHMFGSQWLLNTLGRLGLSVSYDEVYRYKQCVVQSTVDDTPHQFPLSFTQFSGDNVDHNVCTLDGTGSFHGMGIISMTTPCISNGDFSSSDITAIKRLKRVTAENITRNRGIPLLHYHAPDTPALSKLVLKPVHELYHSLPPSTSLSIVFTDLVWHAGFHFQNELGPRPSWSGYMEDVSVPVDNNSLATNCSNRLF